MKSLHSKHTFTTKYTKNVKWWSNCCHLPVKYMLNYLEATVHNTHANSNNILMASIPHV